MAKKRKKARSRTVGVKMVVIDLKRDGASLPKLKAAVKRAARRQVRLIVRNAPFKLCTAEAVS